MGNQTRGAKNQRREQSNSGRVDKSPLLLAWPNLDTPKRTGTLPQEPTDTRTTEEKLADILGLRVEARSLLQDVADGANASLFFFHFEDDFFSEK